MEKADTRLENKKGFSSKKPNYPNKNLKSDNRKGGRRKNILRLSKIKYEEKIIQVKRVTKVVKGGKKMTFRAVVIIGDTKRKVGVGIGRAEDVNLAIDKAILNAKKNLVSIPLTFVYSVPHVVEVSYGSSKIMLRPAALGTGVIAGSSIRTVLELGGVKNILAKQFGSNSLLNNAKATILALNKLNEKIELGRAQSIRKQIFYNKILKKYKNI